MKGDWTVKVEGVWRKFGATVHASLKYGLIDSARRMFGGTKDSTRLRDGEFWALQDVSFELQRGEALGIMGVNGSGKTTLLRILNGTYSPDRGTVMLRGRVGSLIAAGAGFSPMLSGRENVFINATLLGLSPVEIRRRFDEIVDFAGLEPFIDMPVRNYSSGMTVRLGFAIAVMCEPDILLADEVLAVGDLAFQKRCYDRLLSLRDGGTTVIFVSHSVGAIWAVCNSGLFLDRGISSGKISPEDAGRSYDLQNYRNAAEQDARTSGRHARPRDPREREDGTGDVVVESFEVCDPITGTARSEFEFGEALGLQVDVVIRTRIRQAIVRYSIDAMHYKFICNADSSYAEGMGIPDLEPGRYTVRTTIRGQRLRPGAYTINLAICQKTAGVHLFFRAHAGGFIIKPPLDRFLYDSDSLAVVDFEAHFQLTETIEHDGRTQAGEPIDLAASQAQADVVR